MDKKKVPFRKTVFVCVNTRPDGARVACGNPGRGGLELCEALKHAVKEKGLKGKVRVAKSGCLDLCEQGPNAFVYPGDEWYSGVTPQDTAAIVAKLAD
ncbi:MAG: (2Fe-2S) ferredoxin domain-containing protein [Elusimicrobiota bacterium]|nr:MAG: (2Fe-2S) ferredoxin domain-containing protein [Elusimicrobiota bacterium]